MKLEAPWLAHWTLRNRQLLVLLVALLTLIVTPGMMGRLFCARELSDSHPVAVPATFRDQLPVAHLVHLNAGSKLVGQSAPPGWSHVALKSVPMLASGDLDTVSSQAFETARRVRPLILADIRRSEAGLGSTFYLARVGVGLCAPDQDGESDRVVTATSVEGTAGTWTTKQRLILTALAFETSRTRLAAATPTFALLRSPSMFLIGGSHRKTESCYALLVDPSSGELRVVIWQDDLRRSAQMPSEIPARLPASPVFDCPQDVHATRVLGTPVAWSFAIRELPPGTDVTLPADLVASLKEGVEVSTNPSALEQGFLQLLRDQR